MNPIIVYALGALLIIGMIVIGAALEELLHAAINYKRRQNELATSCRRERAWLAQRDMSHTDKPRVA
ncbi:hypothetical protein [Kushneria phosphatilytica]|uniref:Uncharacterized protein n=1 Tax=Kushneria phosphatilytica TaxID=657387 RepID=A0A1S1NYP9_9GAMM|nr:hypothetical protein [Kushneria phosphatilytica]OHV12975.1 hypothetical protein BH688_02945 [Kushneria phosphatilytica]QEL10844.1 hypothetical protein FY550_06710 [Kushneria phosphatilytica]